MSHPCSLFTSQCGEPKLSNSEYGYSFSKLDVHKACCSICNGKHRGCQGNASNLRKQPFKHKIYRRAEDLCKVSMPAEVELTTKNSFSRCLCTFLLWTSADADLFFTVELHFWVLKLGKKKDSLRTFTKFQVPGEDVKYQHDVIIKHWACKRAFEKQLHTRFQGLNLTFKW